MQSELDARDAAAARLSERVYIYIYIYIERETEGEREREREREGAREAGTATE